MGITDPEKVDTFLFSFLTVVWLIVATVFLVRGVIAVSFFIDVEKSLSSSCIGILRITCFFFVVTYFWLIYDVSKSPFKYCLWSFARSSMLAYWLSFTGIVSIFRMFLCLVL